MAIPKLETSRLRLREHQRDDLGRAFLLWSHETVVRFIGAKPNTRPQCWSRLLSYRGHWELMGFGYWAVEEKSSGLYIGDVGFADFKREITPSIEGLPELGWALMPSHHGQGLATEAVRAATAWGDQNLSDLTGQSRAVCLISPENSMSIRVASKAGFIAYDRTNYADAATILFERPFT
jgi:RimJ/RimL family protein N-acetyltransferase